MKNILAAGGTNITRSYSCKRLLEVSNKVICADNLYIGKK